MAPPTLPRLARYTAAVSRFSMRSPLGVSRSLWTSAPLGVLGWAVAASLVTGCDKGKTESPERPSSNASAPARDDDGARIEGAPAALRRDMRTCAREGGQGAIEYGVRVSPTGRVVLATALQSTAPPALFNCTLQRLRAWTFPATTDGAAFRFSMTFGPLGQSVVLSYEDRAKRTIKRRTGQLQHCYNKSLRLDSTIAGKLSYRVLIARSGVVTRATIEQNTGLPAAVARCTVSAIESWTFPMAGATEGVDVSFSILFSGS